MNQNALFKILKFKEEVYFFTDRHKVKDFTTAIKNLPLNSCIIIREYDLSSDERELFCKKIIKIAKIYNKRFLIGKDFNLAIKLKANGVHFSDLDKIPMLFLKKKSFPKNFIFSISCHSINSFLKMIKLKPDKIFCSPIFTTTSHKDQIKIFGIKNIAKIIFKYKNLYSSQTKICALGGVNQNNLLSLKSIKVDGFGAIDLFTKNL